MFKKLNLMCVFAALILMWTTHGLALDHPDGPPMEEVDACFNNGGSPDQCCGMMGDAEGRDMCMKDSGEVDACFNSGGSPDQCCAMIDDEHGRKMCLMHSQDNTMHDGGPGDMGCPPPGMPDHDECMKGMHHDGGPGDMGCPPPGMPDHDDCMKGMHHDGGPGDMGCPPPGMQGHDECMQGMAHGPMGGPMTNDDFVLMCDPEMDYPQADPGPDGCRDYLDCNGNGAYDLEEPCAEHD